MWISLRYATHFELELVWLYASDGYLFRFWKKIGMEDGGCQMQGEQTLRRHTRCRSVHNLSGTGVVNATTSIASL